MLVDEVFEDFQKLDTGGTCPSKLFVLVGQLQQWVVFQQEVNLVLTTPIRDAITLGSSFQRSLVYPEAWSKRLWRANRPI